MTAITNPAFTIGFATFLLRQHRTNIDEFHTLEKPPSFETQFYLYRMREICYNFHWDDAKISNVFSTTGAGRPVSEPA